MGSGKNMEAEIKNFREKLHLSLNNLCENKLNYVLREVSPLYKENFSKKLEENLSFCINLIEFIINPGITLGITGIVDCRETLHFYTAIGENIDSFMLQNNELLSTIGIKNSFIREEMQQIRRRYRVTEPIAHSSSELFGQPYYRYQKYTKAVIPEWLTMLGQYLNFMFYILEKFKKTSEIESYAEITIGDS